MRLNFYPPLDPGIKREVEILFANGVETIESCQGGKGHSFPEPTVRFCGNAGAGWKAFFLRLGVSSSNLLRSHA